MTQLTRKADVAKLLELVSLVNKASEAVISCWENGNSTAETVEGVQLPSHDLFNAQRTILAALGSIEELVSDPSHRLLGFAMQYVESRALQVAAEHRLADMLQQYEGTGLHIAQISQKSGIDQDKLARVLRLLCSQHIFSEVAPDTFANNAVSRALVGNEDLRAYIMLFSLIPYTACDYLPDMLVHPKMGPSYKLEETAFNLAIGTEQSCWDWISNKAPASRVRRSPNFDYFRGTQSNDQKAANGDAGEMMHRREIEFFGQAMFGAGKVFSSPLVFDYPWGGLGRATLVDVGGGIGGFSLQLSRVYPSLNFVIQDREGTVAEGKQFWGKKSPQDLDSGRVRLVPHDFFTENPIKEAEAYLLRYILHDWSDEYCIKILTEIRKAMGPNSRLLIVDQVMNTTIGDKSLTSAPAPLLANYGHYIRFSHQIDLALMSTINGIERTKPQFEHIIQAAGLRIATIKEARTQVSVIECVKAS
ncbi:S-adenosyl-L-methionine-dependent methyltransferase [Camillea tinctor]|nr:S-adenosyl-L-methionine-dependent methyltransferase [Camillea tinctor]